jgi:hypothetical protein
VLHNVEAYQELTTLVTVPVLLHLLVTKKILSKTVTSVHVMRFTGEVPTDF